MSTVTCFTFNPFQENTYIVQDSSLQCIVIDPGSIDSEEQGRLDEFISRNQLTVHSVLNTHCHVDHVFGNRYICEKYNCELLIHKDEMPLLKAFPQICQMYGLRGEESPEPSAYLIPGKDFAFGETSFEVRFTPGHSPASICLVNHAEKYVIAGDVLFQGSIGRTDLPGGNYHTLIESIETQLMALDDEYLVYSGHGPSTSIGAERAGNPFLQKN
ncbi:MAG: MBL fold metallo-hydrolase [Saprospiraceae bacterium]|nr:MBL fold metallo-hydrolase [Saprospiraceae bacterium]